MEQSATAMRPEGAKVGLWISLTFLAILAVVFAILFYQLVRPVAMPLFFAAVVAMLLEPIHRRIKAWNRLPPWLSAGIVTLASLVILVGPLVGTTYFGATKLHAAVSVFNSAEGGSPGGDSLPGLTRESLHRTIEDASGHLGIDPARLRAGLAASAEDLEQAFVVRSLRMLGSLPRAVLSILLFAVAVFFLLKDGEKLAHAWDELTPLGQAHDQAIRREFGCIFRSVVLGTVAAALSQAVSFALGFLIINAIFDLQAAAWTPILAALTLVFASIPFLGAVSVWLPTTLVLLLRDERAAALCMAVYGALIVSQVDTLFRVWILNEGAKLHALLAAVCVCGGILYFGILGVFLGPIVGALLVALLRILKKELLGLSSPPSETGKLSAAAASADRELAERV